MDKPDGNDLPLISERISGAASQGMARQRRHGSLLRFRAMTAEAIERETESGLNASSSERSNQAVQPAISVLIVSYNRAASLDRCLARLDDQTERPDEIVVYLNRSHDRSAELVRERYPNVRLIEADRNFGCPGGRNRGIAACRHDWVLCLDDDGELAADAVARTHAAIRRHPDAAVIAGAYRDQYSPAPENLTEGPSFSFIGGMCIIRRTVFLRLGGYHEDALRQGEEQEYSFRLYDAGEHIYLCPDLILDHHMEGVRPSHQEIFRGNVRQMYLTALRLVPAPALPLWIILKLVSHAITAGRRGYIGALFLGTWDAVRLTPAAWHGRKPVRYRTLVASSRFFRFIHRPGSPGGTAPGHQQRRHRAEGP